MSSRTTILNCNLYTWNYFQNEDVCRLCWSRDAHKVIVVKSSENGKCTKNLLGEKIEDCLNLDLSSEGTPQKVCSKCCDIIENFYDFKRFCCEAERKLKEIFNSHVVKTPGGLPEHLLQAELEKHNQYSDTASYDSCDEDSLQEYLINLTLPKGEKEQIRKDKSKTNNSKTKHNLSVIDSPNSNIVDSFQEYLNLVPVGDQKQKIRKDVNDDNCNLEGLYSGTEASASNVEDGLPEHLISVPLKRDRIKKVLKKVKDTKEKKCGLQRKYINIGKSDINREYYSKEYLNFVPLRGDEIQKVKKEIQEEKCILERKYSDKKISGSDIEDSLEDHLNKTVLRKDQIQKKRKYPNRSPTFCYICRTDFKTIDKFTKHNSERHGIETNGQYKCFGCNKRFKNSKNRLGHEINFCKELKDGYKCGVCGQYLPKRRTYEMHMRAHRSNKPVNLPGELFKCGKCYKLFKTRENLIEHKKSHEIKEDFICEACGRCFSRRDYLNKHKLAHQGLRQHACPHCDYRAVQKTSLLVHLRKHTGERPFRCDLCPQRCVTSSNLRAHRQRHLGVKQFQCTICSKKFGYKQSLEEHIASTHERVAQVQSHTCPDCGAIYTRGRVLQRHIVAKHGKTKQQQVSTTDGAISRQVIVVKRSREQDVNFI